MKPTNLHVTYNFGKEAKIFRLKSSGNWLAESPGYYGDGEFLRVTDMESVIAELLHSFPDDVPESVWRCKEGDVPSALATRECFHPGSLPFLEDKGMIFSRDAKDLHLKTMTDPAMPHERAQLLQRVILRNALAVASALGRILILPKFWCLCDRYWWLLEDCRIPGAGSMPMPFECPLDLLFDVDEWQSELKGVQVRETSFLENRLVPADLHDDRAVLTMGSEPPRETGVQGLDVIEAPEGACADDIAAALMQKKVQHRVLDVDAGQLRALCACGFRGAEARATFDRDVMQAVFSGHVSHCSAERNPNIWEAVERAKRERPSMIVKEALDFYKNCTGDPAKASSKPPVDIGPAALAFENNCRRR